MSEQGKARDVEYEVNLRVNQAIDAINDLFNIRTSPELAAHAPDLVNAGSRMSEVAIAALARKYKEKADAAAS